MDLGNFQESLNAKKGFADNFNALLKELPLKVNVQYDFVVQSQVSYDDPNNVIYRIVDSFMVI